jgi:hypothetical protein
MAYLRSHSGREKQSAWARTTGFVVIGVLLLVILLIIGFPRNLWSPLDAENENNIPAVVVTTDSQTATTQSPASPRADQRSVFGEFVRCFLLIGLIASVSVALTLGPQTSMEDSEVRGFAAGRPHSTGPIINPPSAMLGLIACWGLLFCIVFVIRYLYLLLILVL